jgi:hypothetical protein
VAFARVALIRIFVLSALAEGTDPHDTFAECVGVLFLFEEAIENGVLVLMDRPKALDP